MSDLSDYEYEYEDEDADEAMETASSAHNSLGAVVSLENSLNGLVNKHSCLFQLTSTS